MAGRLEGRVAVVTGGCSGIGLATVRRFAEEGATVVIGDLDDAAGEPVAQEVGGAYVHCDVTDADEVERAVRDRQGAVRQRRHRVQQRGHLAARRRLDPHHRPRRVAPGAGGQPDQRLPVLQGRPALHARAEARVDHQHRVVRRRDGRRDEPDLLHRQQGRRAVDVARARGAVRPRGGARQRAVPGAGQHPAAAGAVRQGPRAGRTPHGAHPGRAGSPSPSRSPTPCCSSPATSQLHHGLAVPRRRRDRGAYVTPL